MASGSKQYGLILPSKKFNITEVKRPTVFNNDSDSDEDSKEMGTSDWIKKSFQKQAAQSVGVRKQTEIDMKKEQDPTVYEYDEIYDEIEKKKLDEQKKKKDEKKKPRYIQALLKKAEQRKIENERRIERQVQKEREAEGEQFKDKETFVTSAYKKKLEEFNKLDEEERRQDMLEEICDVSKQQDLGGFYRHLYRTTVDKDNLESHKDKKSSIKSEDNVANKDNDNKDSKTVVDKKAQRDKRQYRKRKSSESSSIEEGERNSDSDTSISSSSSSASESDKENENSNSEKLCKDGQDNENEKTSEPNQKKIKVDENVIKEEKREGDTKTDISSGKAVTDESNKENSSTEPSKSVIKEEKPKINIWEKRTVGPVFEAALKRYFERKAERQAVRSN